MSDRIARYPDLATLVEVYPEDKRVTAVLPAADFGEGVAKGDEVTLTIGTDTLFRKPDPASGSATARVKRIMVEVEVDLSTFKAGKARGQGALDVEAA